MPPLNVLIVSQHYWPETFRINEIALSLQNVGCKVSVLTGQPNYPDGVVFPGYRASAWTTELHADGYTIYRVPLFPRGSGSAPRLVLNYLSFILFGCTLGPWMLRRTPIDIVFVYGTSPILQAIVGMAVSRIRGVQLMTWVQDLWPESLTVTGYVSSPRILKAVAAVVKWIYRHNDLLLVQSSAFLERVRVMAGRVPVEVHHNPGELAFENPAYPHEPALRLPSKFTVVFAGNLGMAQALDTVIEAANLLKDESHIAFVLIGSGVRYAWLQQQISSLELQNVHLPGRFPPEQMPSILVQASVLLVSLVRGAIMSETIPSKVQAYLAAGRPIIGSLDGEGARVIAEAGAGYSCAAEDAPALAMLVHKLSHESPDVLAAMGAAGRTYYLNNFEPDMLAQRLRDRMKRSCAIDDTI